MSSSRGKDIHGKLEGESLNEKFSKTVAQHAAASSSGATVTSRQWSGFKNPRIVRVSHTFGGKDRHSKVCTIRGLRDRRIRLSVPTAIQLYDLQDRLGLSQPSKVIDWLMDATKLDIDKLPPLQMPPGNFAQFHQTLLGPSSSGSVAAAPPPHFTSFLDANLTLMKDGSTHNSAMMLSRKEEININDDVDEEEGEDQDDQLSLMEMKLPKIKWNSHTAVNNGPGGSQLYRGGGSSTTAGQVSAQSLFPAAGSNGSLPGLMNNPNSLQFPYSNYYHWDPSTLSLCQFRGRGSLVHSQTDGSSSHPQNNSSMSLAYHHNPAGGSHQLFFCPPPAAATTSFFPQHASSYVGSGAAENDMSRQLSRLHELSSSSSQLAPSLFHSGDKYNGSQPNKGSN